MNLEKPEQWLWFNKPNYISPVLAKFIINVFLQVYSPMEEWLSFKCRPYRSDVTKRVAQATLGFALRRSVLFQYYGTTKGDLVFVVLKISQIWKKPTKCTDPDQKSIEKINEKLTLAASHSNSIQPIVQGLTDLYFSGDLSKQKSTRVLW